MRYSLWGLKEWDMTKATEHIAFLDIQVSISFPKRESFSLLSYVDLDPTLSVLVRFLVCGIYLAIYEFLLFEVFFFNSGGFKRYFFKYFPFSIFIFWSPSRIAFVQVLGRDPFTATL